MARAGHPIESLAGDGQWRELGTSTPLPAGDIGGDGQDSEAYSRRFGKPMPGGTWAVVTIYWYVQNLTDSGGEIFLERQEEYMICADAHDVGGTEIWCDYRYLKELDFGITESGALLAAADYDPATEIVWSGRETRGKISG